MAKAVWYPAATSKELGRAPLGIAFLGQRLVLFRGQGGVPSALLDRCPHRGVSLSLGEVRGGDLACPYHGWRFGADGRCTLIPSASDAEPRPKCAADAFPCVEAQGTVWVSSTRERPDHAPSWPRVGEPGYRDVELLNRIECPQLQVVQNFVDCAHTGILHRGLFRGEPSKEIRAHVELTPDGVAAENFGETNPTGLLVRLLQRGNGGVRHTDTFRAPHTVEVNYWWGERHLVTTSICTPETDTTTRVYTRIAMKFGLMDPLLLIAIRPFTARIFQQDKRILEDQARQLKRYPEAPRASSAADLPCLWVEEAHRAATEPAAPPVSPRTKDVQYKL